jgi:hypothetical protein
MEETMFDTQRAAGRPLVAALCLALPLLTASDLFAFKQGYHEQVTEAVCSARGFDTNSADEVGDSNYWTDVFESSNESAHADNNHLGGASDRLRAKRTAIGDALNRCERRPALDALGEALHTVQDIYSHSNTIDNGLPIADLLGLANGTAPCALPNFAPTGLVTGYFSVGGFFTGNQCRGIPAGMCCHRDLNKDEPGAENGARHPAALAGARTATEVYLGLVEDDIRARFGEPKATQLIKLLKRSQRMVYFVIDDTGSMGTDLAGVKAAVGSFIDQTVAGDEAPTLGLVSFKDSSNDRGISCDVNQVRGWVNGLFASGGGDCPEASNGAMLRALSHFPVIGSELQATGGRLLLATDASAGDASLGPTVVQQAIGKGVSIDTILTGDCVAEELTLEGGGSDIEPSCNDPEAGEPAGGSLAEPESLATNPLTSLSARTQLRAITEQTGGVLFSVSRTEVDDVVPTLLELSQPEIALLVSRKVTVAGGVPYVLDVPVDETLTGTVTFLVTAARFGVLPQLSLARPDGSAVLAGQPGVTVRNLSSVKSFAIGAPVVGRWRLRLDGAGDFVVRAFGRSSLRMNSLRMVEAVVDPDRPEVEAQPLEGQPLVGDAFAAHLRLSQAPLTLAAALRRLDGTLVDDLDVSPLEDPLPRRFRVSSVVPLGSFLVEASGLTAAGNEYLRVGKIPVVPQTVKVELEPRQAVAAPGAVASFAGTISNLADSPASFRIRLTLATGWTGSAPATVAVPASGSALFTVAINVPASAPDGEVMELGVAVEDLAASSTNNSTTASVRVLSNRPPECAGVTVTPAELWPPNHDLRSVALGGVIDPDGDPVALAVTGITSDEPVTGGGSGNTAPDATGLGTASPAVRAERRGSGDGRVYAIGFTADDGRGGSCSGTVNVAVPHDAAHAAVDSGQNYDAFGN